MVGTDIIKGVVYERGYKEFKGERKYLSLVAMIVASDEPLIEEDSEAFICMGSANITEEIKKLQRYKCPYKMGHISNAIVDLSTMNPANLKPL